MRRLIFFLAFALTLSFASQAQNGEGKITGKVVDGSSKIVEAATIALVRASDSAVVKIGSANKDGHFSFDGILPGRYFVSVSAVGHQKGFTETVEITGPGVELSLKTIELVPETKSLAGVTVVAKKPLIEQKLDRMVVNVEAAATNVGASALEVLEKSPGISVDKDGNISLKGKQGVQVYIDGRPSYLSGADLANLLRNMGSNQLDQIEIMTNPPAKYDAAGNSGIINIKTKKNRQMGYNGNLNSTWSQGRYPKVSESFTFNYRKNKINLFTNVGFNYRKNFQNLDIQRRFIDPGTKLLRSNFEQASRIRETSKSLYGKIGMDYFASKKTTLGVVFSGFNNPGTFYNGSTVYVSDPAATLESITAAYTNNDRQWKNYSANLNFRHVFDSTGRELTADLDHLRYKSTNAQELVNAYFDPVWAPLSKADTLLGDLPQDIQIYTAKLDYTHPLKNGVKLEAGLKTSFVKTDNNARYDSLVNGAMIIDAGRSNHFVYQENVNAAYVNLSKEFNKKFSGQLGLRFENTSAKGDQLTTGDDFNRNYNRLFPTLFLQYSPSEKNSFGLNYGKRIERPDYADMNPFIMFLDKYTFEQGNPELQPQFAHNVELSHTFKGFLTTTLNYSYTTDRISDVLEQNPDKNETRIRKFNIATERQMGISVAAGFPLTKWWNANIWVNVFNNRYEGPINNENVVLGATTGQTNLSNQFKFEKGWGGEISGFYQTRAVEGIFDVKGLGMMNIAVTKQILKGKGTLRLNLRDVLYSQKVNGVSRYSNIDVAFQQVRDSRQVALGFTWRFSKGKAGNTPKRKTGGAGDEQNRVKTGGDN